MSEAGKNDSTHNHTCGEDCTHDHHHHADDAVADFFEEVSFEDLSDTKKRVTVKVIAKYFDSVYQKELAKVAQKANFKGFRPGKVPKAMVEKLHGSSVQIQSVDAVVNSSISGLAKKRTLDVITVTDLKVDPKNFAAPSPALKEGLEYSATLVLYPKPEIKDYKKLSISVEKQEITDKEVQEAINNIRKSRATLTPVTSRDVPAEDDVVTLEVAIAAEGQDAGRPEPMTTELKDQKLPEEVRAELLKTKVGDSRQVELTFNDSYPDASLRGQKGTYSYTLKSISERVLPEVDDEFAKSSGLGAESAADFNEKVLKALEEEVENRTKNDVEVELLKEVAKNNPFEVPQELIDEEIRNLAVRVGLVDPNKTDVRRLPVESLRAPLGAVAEERVKAVIIVDRIAEQESLRATEDEMKAKITETANMYGVSEDDVRKFIFQDQGGINMLMDITRNKVLDMLKQAAKIGYKKPAAKEEAK